jgi:hypothetical protein
VKQTENPSFISFVPTCPGNSLLKLNGGDLVAALTFHCASATRGVHHGDDGLSEEESANISMREYLFDDVPDGQRAFTPCKSSRVTALAVRGHTA